MSSLEIGWYLFFIGLLDTFESVFSVQVQYKCNTFTFPCLSVFDNWYSAKILLFQVMKREC